MNRDALRRGLTCCLVAVILLPVAITAVMALGGLLGSLGDATAASVCGRVALVLGAAFAVMIVATTVASAGLVLAPPPRPRRPRRRLRRRRAADGGTGGGAAAP